MKLRLLPALFSVLLLAACSSSARDITLSERLQNPLFAYSYYTDLLQQLVNFEIYKDKILENSERKEIVENARTETMARQLTADTRRKTGRGGNFVRASDSVTGHALVIDDTLYLGTDFFTPPGLDLHVYASTSIDPRDEEAFPTKESADLGVIHSNTGDQTYTLPAAPKGRVWNTIVLYDVTLQRVYGFVQLQEEE